MCTGARVRDVVKIPRPMSSLSGILLSILQPRRNGSRAPPPPPKLPVGTREVHHLDMSGWRSSSAYTYALRATTGGSAIRSESDLLWRRVSACSCTGSACEEGVVCIYRRLYLSTQSSSRYKCSVISVSGFRRVYATQAIGWRVVSSRHRR